MSEEKDWDEELKKYDDKYDPDHIFDHRTVAYRSYRACSFVSNSIKNKIIISWIIFASSILWFYFYSEIEEILIENEIILSENNVISIFLKWIFQFIAIGYLTTTLNVSRKARDHTTKLVLEHGMRKFIG